MIVWYTFYSCTSGSYSWRQSWCSSSLSRKGIILYPCTFPQIFFKSLPATGIQHWLRPEQRARFICSQISVYLFNEAVRMGAHVLPQEMSWLLWDFPRFCAEQQVGREIALYLAAKLSPTQASRSWTPLRSAHTSFVGIWDLYTVNGWTLAVFPVFKSSCNILWFSLITTIYLFDFKCPEYQSMSEMTYIGVSVLITKIHNVFSLHWKGESVRYSWRLTLEKNLMIRELLSPFNKQPLIGFPE